MELSKVVLAIASVALGLAAVNAHAQDAVKVCPKNFKVLAEDDITRVLHFTQKKGETCGMHSHPYIVAYVIKSGRITFVAPDGTKTKSPKIEPGSAVQRGPTTHAHESVEADAEAITIEYKK
jgi:quercetin dioxygenase-like cupin family protein